MHHNILQCILGYPSVTHSQLALYAEKELLIVKRLLLMADIPSHTALVQGFDKRTDK